MLGILHEKLISHRYMSDECTSGDSWNNENALCHFSNEVFCATQHVMDSFSLNNSAVLLLHPFIYSF